MATIIDNLNTIVGIKEDIRNAIADKGVDMVDVPFSEFPDKIATIETGGGDGDYQTGYEEGYEAGETSQKSKLTGITITENGTYSREDGYNEVIVDVPQEGGDCPELEEITITENGTYEGTYNKVNVNVPNTDLTTIDVGEIGLKFGNSLFSEVPEVFDFSNVTDMSRMFYWCKNLQTIPLIDTSNVTDMSYMFQLCSNLQTIPALDTSNVTDMSSMFSNCKILQTIPLIDTSNVSDMDGMFHSCDNLTTIPGLDTSNVKDMGSMFNSCVNLISLPSLNVAKITTINYYFGPTILENLTDVGGWIGLKINWNDNFGLAKCSNLTYQSCINILNGLADVTELGSRTLKVHQNFINLVGEEISIGINKGWTISA